MSKLIDYLFVTIFLITWIAGFIIAKGFWSTLFCWIPFWAFYLVIEKLMLFYNLI